MGYSIRKVDANQPSIVDAFRAMGVSVWITSTAGQGAPDLVVGESHWCVPVEIKSQKGELTPDQQKWVAGWGGPYFIVRSPQEAHQLVAEMRMRSALASSAGCCGRCRCQPSAGQG